jgi:transposase
MAYSSSLTDAEWEILEPLLPEILPPKKSTRPLEWSYREIIDGILYRLKNGCNWADLPQDLPPYSTVYWHYKQWREAGTVEQLMTIFHEQVRGQVGKKPQWTTLIMIDSQAVKNTCNASVKTKGFCFYKATNGIKRHLAVDSLGFPFFTHCTPANVSDDDGLIEMLSQHMAFSRLVRYNSYLLLFSNILIMKPHSIAFRQKIIEVHEAEDISQRKLAKRFNVALSFIQKLLKQYRETDSLTPKVRTQQTPAKLNDEHLTVLRRLVEERNDATLEELRKQLIHETGIDVSRSTIDRALNKLGLTLKKRRSMLTRRKLSESSLSV